MLPSGNDAATQIALHLSGSVENFAKLMNIRAKEMGLKDTHFVTPHGLDNDNHFTNYFSPKTNNVLLREMITCTEDVINFLSESSSDFIQRTGRSYEDWYTLRNDVNESIDWSIAPYEVYGARFIPRQ